MHVCALVANKNSRTHTLRERKRYQEECNVPDEEMKIIHECDMEAFGVDNYLR